MFVLLEHKKIRLCSKQHSHDKLVPVTTAWRMLWLRMEEWSPIWRVAANISNEQTRTANTGYTCSLGMGKVLTTPHCENMSLLRNTHRQSLWSGVIIWYNLSNKRGKWDLLLGMLGACIWQVRLWQQPGNYVKLDVLGVQEVRWDRRGGTERDLNGKNG
jgi:hypothetical protein